jgi:sugar/nucleoside kinase (ribokinase family)
METTLRQGAMRAVVVHFPEGALALSRDGAFFGQGSLAMPAELVVGANGAGDAFAAGFLYGQHEGWGFQDSLALGHCVAATSMRALSTTTSVAPWRECLQLADRWGFRESPVARVNG